MKASRRKKRRKREALRASGICPKCIDSYVESRMRTFSDGTMHLQLVCSGCGGHIKWGEK